MPDLRIQIRRYARELEKMYPDIGFDELLERVTPPHARRISNRKGLAIALAAAVVVLVLVGGAAVLNLFGGSEPPAGTLPSQSTTSSAPEPTTDVPGVGALEPSQVESMETSLGRWTWTRYDGDLSELEAATPTPSPVSGAVAVPESVPAPAIEGFDWQPAEAFSASLDGVTVTVASHFGAIDWAAFFGEAAFPSWDPSRRSMEFFGIERTLIVDVVRGIPDAVEFRDGDTGELVLRVESTDPEVVVEQLTGEASHGSIWGPMVWQIEVDDGATVWIEPPWLGLAVDFVRVTSTTDGLVLIAVGRPGWEESDRTSMLWSWRSEDGRSWEPFGDPVRIGDTATGLTVASNGSVVVALLTGSGPTGLGGGNLVALIDGSRWSLVEADLEGFYHPFGFGPLTSGWVLAGFRQEERVAFFAELCDVWLSTDGVDWERIAYSPDITGIEAVTATGCYVSGETVVALQDFESDGVRWIGRLDR